jgi:hypothetical protein
MTEKDKPADGAALLRAQLPEEVRLILKEIEREAVPEKLLLLAGKLQKVLAERLAKESGEDV